MGHHVGTKTLFHLNKSTSAFSTSLLSHLLFLPSYINNVCYKVRHLRQEWYVFDASDVLIPFCMLKFSFHFMNISDQNDQYLWFCILVVPIQISHVGSAYLLLFYSLSFGSSLRLEPNMAQGLLQMYDLDKFLHMRPLHACIYFTNLFLSALIRFTLESFFFLLLEA